MTYELLDQHVDRFNRAVRTADWEQMTTHFTEDAELHFEGVPVGPFKGREAITQAYRDHPPDDEVRILKRTHVGSTTSAVYAWAADPERPAGLMHLGEREGRISHLVVTFDSEA
jgi:hypothetical protein